MNNPHKNARTTPLGRAEMVRRIREGQPVAAVAARFGISERTARKWLERFEKEGPPGLENRSSRPKPVANHTCAPRLVSIERLRREYRLTGEEIAEKLSIVDGSFDGRRLAHAPRARAACSARTQGARASLPA
jgi:transposase